MHPERPRLSLVIWDQLGLCLQERRVQLVRSYRLLVLQVRTRVPLVQPQGTLDPLELTLQLPGRQVRLEQVALPRDPRDRQEGPQLLLTGQLEIQGLPDHLGRLEQLQ